MKKFLLFAAFIGLMINAHSQVSLYNFSQSTGVYTPITGGSVLGVTNNDDTNFPALPIGFDFWYNGANYNTFSINTNGFIALGNTIGSSYDPITAGATTNNVISAFADDLQGEIGSGELRFQTVGVAPNRTLVVQWKNYDHYQSALNTSVYNFQIRLSETTNVINVVYGSCTNNILDDVQVGLRGASAADYNIRSHIGVPSGSWDSTVVGLANTDILSLNGITSIPSNGKTFTWAPPVGPLSPTTLTFTGVTNSAMTLNWVDNSTDEIGFAIYRSLDGISYTFAGNVLSATTATTGTAYNSLQTGLSSSTLYHWQVFAYNTSLGFPSLAGSQTTLGGALCGTYTVGPTGAYTSLTAAFNDAETSGLSCPCNFELQAAYVSTVETFPLDVPFFGGSPLHTITVRPELVATNLSITSASSQTINMDSTTYVTFDGRPGGVGTTSHLTIENTSTTGSAVQFINSARNNTLTYLSIRGVNTSTTSGVVVFGSGLASAPTGNSFNSINNSSLFDGATTPNNLIYSASTIGFNEYNTVTNNRIYNFYSATTATNGVLLTTNSNYWGITNNSFYQTTTRNYTGANTHYAIRSTGGGTYGHTVNGNFIGGTAASCGGSAWTTTGAVATRFVGIELTGNGVAAHDVQGNTIRNFNFSSTSGATTANGIWCAINIIGANNSANVGTITPNIVGSNSTANEIVTSTSTTGGLTVGINSSATGTVNITGNQIGGITANTTLPTLSSSIVGIQNSGGSILTIDNNTIGSTTILSSLINATSTSTTGGQVTGILSTGGNTVTITGNTIQNLTNQYTGTSTAGLTRGISSSTGISNIANNNISQLASISTGVGTGATSTVIGISATSTTTGASHLISNNNIIGLANGNPGAVNVAVTGIHYTNGTAQQHTVTRNRVFALGSNSTGAPIITGINVVGGTTTFTNNMVNLGTDGAGVALPSAHSFIGINKTSTTNNKFFFNTVSIAGTTTGTATQNTFAFRRTATAVDSLINNIFVNNRSNATTGGIHYALNLNNATTLVSNNNIIYGTGTGYIAINSNAVDYASISAWNLASSQDANSFSVNPNFISATDLHINNAILSVLESRAIPIGGVIVDYDLQSRPGPAGSVNGGGTAPDIGADELDGIPVTTDVGITLLVNPGAAECHSSTDSVIVRLRNFATSAIIDFSLNPVTINGSVTGPNPATFGPVVISTGTLAASSTMDVVIGLNYNMTALGTYTFNASAVTPLDFINSNDAMATTNITVSGGTVLANQQAICAGANVTLTNTGATAGGTFQWEISQNGSVWSNIPAATSNPYVYTDASTGPDTLYFKSTSCGLHTSTTIDTVIINYVIPGIGFDTARCGPGLLDLHAAGAGLITWYDAAVGGSALDTGVVYTPFLNQTDTFYVETSTGTAAGLYTSTFAAGNGSSGNMFAITAINTITITSFDGHVTSGTSDWRIDYRPDNIHLVPGSNTSAAGWTLIGTATGVPAGGTGLPTPIPIPVNITIPAGQTFSFHVMTTGGSTVQYTNGTLTGSPFSSNADLTLLQGFGGTSFNCTFNPRVFNGRVHYTAGCASTTRDTVVATVTPPPAINATSSSGTSICTGTSFDNNSIFNVTSVDTNYTYSWTPALGLSSATGATVTATPAATTTYIVNANNPITGCANYDTLILSVNLAPQFTATVDQDTICDGAVPVVLNASFGSLNDTIGFGTVQNSTTSYPTPYGNFYWGARHQFLITAADLASFGVTAGNITGLAFDVVTPSGTPLIDFEIQMAPTTLTDLGTAWETTGFTVVFPADTVTPVAGWNIHNFTNNFTWDGVSNIVVQTCFNNTSFIDNDIVNQTTTSYVASRWFRQDAIATCPNPSVTGTASQRPNMVLYKTANFQNDWSPIATVQYPDSLTTNASPLVTTDYVFTSLDTISGCFNYDTARVTVLPPFAVNGYVTPTISCFGGTDTLVANASGGYGNYSYLWSDALGTGDSASVTGLPFDFTVGVTVTDGCGSITDSITIDIADPMSVTSTDTANCGPGTGFVLSSTVTGGNGVNSYSWTGGSTSSTSTTGLVSTTTNYTVTVTDGCGTTATSVSTVTINTPPTVNLGPDVIQPNPPAILDAGAGFTYLWSTSATTQTINVTTNGTYFVTITDANNCTDSDTIQVNFTAGINNPDGSTATVSYYPNPTNGVLNMMIEGFMGKELKMEVMDIEGRVIRNYVFAEVTETYTSQIDLTTLRAGTYLVVLHTATDSYTHRIVITTNY